MPDFSLEEQIQKRFVIGVDEAGCGPWAGPVVAGAVLFLTYSLPSYLEDLLDDSKKMSAVKREKAYKALLQAEKEGALIFASAFSSVDEIDQLNIRQAALTAMERAAHKIIPLIQRTHENPSLFPQQKEEANSLSNALKDLHILADGTGKPGLECSVTSVVKGDSKSLSIAAASIVAKVERDKEMHRLALLYPGYGWEKNAGYGTKQHQVALDELGITPHHRQSFAPIRQRLAS